MIHFNVNFKGWEIEVFVVLNAPDPEIISRKLKELECPKSTYKKALNTLNYIDTGFTYSNHGKSILVVNKNSSLKEFVNTYNHEKNHVEMHMCEMLNIDPYSEEAAYLSGELAKVLFTALADILIRILL